MATAKATASITISRIVDIESVTRYYLLQSSTASTPSKPTAKPPGDSWVTTEPGYTSGSTNTLYFVDLTVFTNGTYSYSDVSKSSSYEAAKEAYNKAVAAGNAVTALDQSLTQQEVFNRLFNNGVAQGFVLEDGKVYINAEYINSGLLSADRIDAASLAVKGLLGESAKIGASGGVTASFTSNGVVIGTPEGETPVYNFYLSKSAAMAALLAPNINIAANGTTTIGGNIVDITGLITKLPAGTKYNGTLLSELFAEKAPSGYGLGEKTSNLLNDLSTCVNNGWYATGGSTANVPSGFEYSAVFVKTRINRIVQELTTLLDNGVGLGTKLIRVSTDNGSTWTEEWVNPPMALGVEYRTTKRYLGKPVYTRAINFGALPNATSKNVVYPDAEATMVSLHGVLSNGNSFASGYNWDRSNAGKFWVDNTKWNIRILTEGDASSVSAVVVVEYAY